MEITDLNILCNGLKEGKLGLALARFNGTIAGVFTNNRIKAAPVIVCRENISSGFAKGLIVNSGNANAYTGEKGIERAREMCRIAGKLLKCDAREIAVASTGVIGRELDIEWIRKKASEVFAGLGKTRECAERFSNAIKTTDKFVKKAYSNKAKIVAVAKGAGMIAPNLATMLCFIFTSAKFEATELQDMLKNAIKPLNRLTVDGDTSTNDTVLLVALGDEKIAKEIFEEELRRVCYSIARQIASDGEGATKVFEVIVKGAKNDRDAEVVAKSIAKSLLVKTAIFGSDPNWGRIISTIGYSGAEVDDKITVIFENDEKSVKLVENGFITGKEEEAREIMRRDFRIVIDLHKGDFEDFAIGCDLSYEYVRINSEYTT
ncbi:MAG: bifunctional ornithine acetyltransferase/N-acetylglutamate synthase [Archaeoglobaceae archaeon]|nr:bifunctional ornithine acetyltransferase/N-acetylglutamate synthase [Archaeoglobaceae archaeon]MDW7990108.1 bifunctional ornithine acetyltransferase/N-acetylglutamate synthase [Archaeoglobaceae archaeon]